MLGLDFRHMHDPLCYSAPDAIRGRLTLSVSRASEQAGRDHLAIDLLLLFSAPHVYLLTGKLFSAEVFVHGDGQMSACLLAAKGARVWRKSR